MHMIVGGADRHAERSMIVRELLRLTASVNMRHRTTGATPLLRAAGSGAPELVSLLLELRADPNVPNNDGLTPLDAAARSNSQASMGSISHYFNFKVWAGICGWEMGIVSEVVVGG